MYKQWNEKPTKIVGPLKTVGPKNYKCFLLLYQSRVRPIILEYAVPVWSPYLKKNIKELEINVQR